MQKLAILFTALYSILASWAAYSEATRYISDDLTTQTFSGPGSEYRITGSIMSGEQVIMIEESPSQKYALIRYNNGKQHWIPSDKLANEPSARVLVPQLKQQVQQLTDELAGINSTWNQKTLEMQSKLVTNDVTIASLTKENTQLKSELDTAKKKMDDISLQLDDKQREIIQQWFMYGGGVAGIGLLLGIFLPSFMPRRKSKDRWMN